MATIAAVGGLLGILGHRIIAPKHWPMAIWAFLAFIVWVYVSRYWSPYDDPREFSNATRFILGVPLYGLFIYALAVQPPRLKRRWAMLLMVMVSVSAIVFLIDFTTGYSVTRLIDPEAWEGDIEKNLGHGVSVLVISMPSILILWAMNKGSGVWAAATVIVMASTAFFASGNAAVVLALIASLFFMAIALRAPKLAIKTIITALMVLILTAPIIALSASYVSADMKASLPFSWEWRVETWGYLWDKIGQAPLFGNGFDSLRSFTDTFDTRGFEDLTIVPMHAHNIGLHIWTETGLIGVLLCLFALHSTGRAVTQAAWLTHPRAIAIAGSLGAITVMASLSYGAWQDWWLGAIFIALSLPALIQSPNEASA